MRMWRDWLDKEHGIDWVAWEETMKDIDKTYWITEKEERKKLQNLGKF